MAETPAAETAVVKPVKDKSDNTMSPLSVEHVDALALAITKDGAWEYIDGERIYEKEVYYDQNNLGHTVLKVRTFEKDTNRIKQPNGQKSTIHLFDTASSCIQYYEEVLQKSPYYDEIAEITSKYDDKLKTFMPVVKDKYGDTYDTLLLWGFQKYGPKSKQSK